MQSMYHTWLTSVMLSFSSTGATRLKYLYPLQGSEVEEEKMTASFKSLFQPYDIMS